MGTIRGRLRQARCQPLPRRDQGETAGLTRLSGRIPASRGHRINRSRRRGSAQAPRTEVRLGAPAPAPGRHGPVTP